MLLFLFVYIAVAVPSGTLKKNEFLSIKVNNEELGLVLDSNWKWIHDGVIEGIELPEYEKTYGISKQGDNLILKFVTVGQYGTNYGSRVYVTEKGAKKYKFFDLRDKIFSVTVDVSQLPCGLNGAIYFVQMPDVDASMGIGYCDAQLPDDLKIIGDEFNTKKQRFGCSEFDISEMNSNAIMTAGHTCMKNGKPFTGICTGSDCGVGSDRYKGVCDKDGSDLNLYRLGNRDLYGPSDKFKINTLKPFTIEVEFDKDIVHRRFIQDGKIIQAGDLIEAEIKERKKKFGETYYPQGGLLGFPLDKLVLVLSLWDDTSTHMKWLDSTYGSGPGAVRGPCTGNQSPEYLRKTFPDSKLIIKQISLRPRKGIKEEIIPPKDKEPKKDNDKIWVCKSCLLVEPWA
tara:strand:- start:1176 stop:2369 length:1194 start_codon:yes stop_codon:yes gene_type:complete